MKAQIAAGEFGPALQTAKSANDAVERTQLLKTIADAQRKTGNGHAADVAISRIPVPQSRDKALPKMPRVPRRPVVPRWPGSSST